MKAKLIKIKTLLNSFEKEDEETGWRERSSPWNVYFFTKLYLLLCKVATPPLKEKKNAVAPLEIVANGISIIL